MTLIFPLGWYVQNKLNEIFSIASRLLEMYLHVSSKFAHLQGIKSRMKHFVFYSKIFLQLLISSNNFPYFMHKFQIDICNLLEFLKRYNNTISSFLARMLFKRYLNFMRAFLPDFNFMYSTSIYPKLLSDFNMMASNCSISQKLYYFIIIFSMISSFIRVN